MQRVDYVPEMQKAGWRRREASDEGGWGVIAHWPECMPNPRVEPIGAANAESGRWPFDGVIMPPGTQTRPAGRFGQSRMARHP